MKKQSVLKLLPLTVLLFSVLNCSTVPKPPDVFVFEALSQRLSTDPVTDHLILTPSPTCMKEIAEPECGHGTSIVTGKELFIGENAPHLFSGKPWSQVKRESVYVPSVESYAPLSTYIINSCKKMNCSDDVTRFKIPLDKLKVLPAPVVTP